MSNLWKGAGVLVALVSLSIFILTSVILDLLGGKGYYDNHSWAPLAAGAIGAGILWFIGDLGNADEDETVHSFLMIPMQYWAIPLLIGAVVIAALGGPKPAKVVASAETKRSDTLERALASPEATSTHYPETRAEAMQASAAPAAAPVQAPVVETPAAPVADSLVSDAPKIAKVWADNRTKFYYTEECAGRPDTAYQMAKSLAVRQGYRLAPGCQ